MDTNLYEQFADGFVTVNGQTTNAAGLPWIPHKTFAGVELKDLVSAGQTDQRFTCHLVRIAPGKSIGRHNHPTSVEIHEVIAGDGVCVMGEKTLTYTPGNVAVIPAMVEHEVHAGENGLCLFAKFINV